MTAFWSTFFLLSISFLWKVNARPFESISEQRPLLNAAPLRVHLVPHSHDDVGWLRTIDEYYNQQVFRIYENIVEELWADNSKRFIVVEQAYFQRWWLDTNAWNRERFTTLLSRKQVEFVNGGWVVNDEASVTAESMTAQLQLGRAWIQRTFGDTVQLPRISYQIDPFGHSSGVASVFLQMGYEAVILNRVHHQERREREENGTMAFLWNGRLLAHILDRHYSSPPGCDFEFDRPIGDEEDLRNRAEQLAKQWLERSRSYPQQQAFLQLIGDDFRFFNARKQFENWDRLIAYINTHADQLGVSVQYSTLTEYFDQLNRVSIAWTKGNQLSLHQDFFPYADNEHSYWTGYFVSKGWLKHMIRQLEHLLRFAEISTVQLQLEDPSKLDRAYTYRILNLLRETVSELQHHDAITGTSTRRVTEMYRQHIVKAAKRVRELLLTQKRMYDFRGLDSDTDEMSIVLFNALMSAVETVHSMPVNCKEIAVYDSFGECVPSQVIVNDDTQSGSDYKLYFPVRIPALGQAAYTLRRDVDGVCGSVQSMSAVTPQNVVAVIENDFLVISARKHNHGLSLRVFNKENGVITHLDPTLAFYRSFSHMNQQSSGAYIFRTSDHEPRPLLMSGSMEIVRGPVINEIRVRYNQNVQLVIRLPQLSHQLEIESRFQSIEKDTEIVLQLGTGDQCQLYTDANGQWPMARGHQYNPDNKNPAADFYPVTLYALAHCPASNQALRMILDRPLGCAYRDTKNVVECMIHRRTSRDDGRGVGEPLDDVQPIHPTIRLSFDRITEPLLMDNQFQTDVDLMRYPPLMMVGRIRSADGDEEDLLQFEGTSNVFQEPVSVQRMDSWRLISAQTLISPNETTRHLHLLLRVQPKHQSSQTEQDISQMLAVVLSQIAPSSQWIRRLIRNHQIEFEEMELSGVLPLSTLEARWRWSSLPVPHFDYARVRTFRITIPHPSHML